jgi:hypothetical protein
MHAPGRIAVMSDEMDETIEDALESSEIGEGLEGYPGDANNTGTSATGSGTRRGR